MYLRLENIVTMLKKLQYLISFRIADLTGLKLFCPLKRVTENVPLLQIISLVHHNRFHNPIIINCTAPIVLYL